MITEVCCRGITRTQPTQGDSMGTQGFRQLLYKCRGNKGDLGAYASVCPSLATPLVCCAMFYTLRSIVVWYLQIVHLKVRIGDV